MLPKKRGLLIVIDGISKVGKTTQVDLLADWFIKKFNEPTYRITMPGKIVFTFQTTQTRS
jgi:thymidylate kinase